MANKTNEEKIKEQKQKKLDRLQILEIISGVLSFCSIILSVIIALLSKLRVGTLFIIIFTSVFAVAMVLVTVIFVALSFKAKKAKRNELDNYYNRIRESVGLPYKPYFDKDNTVNISSQLKEISNLVNKKPEDEQTGSTIREAKGDDILGLMADSMTEIREYYLLSKSQAKSSFIFAILMSIFGFLLIAASIILAIIFSENLTATIISAIGAVVVELLSATFLYVYKKSLEQLNHYYSELHENEKFLSAVNLVNKINADKRDDVFIEIIRSRLVTDSNKSNNSKGG